MSDVEILVLEADGGEGSSAFVFTGKAIKPEELAEKKLPQDAASDVGLGLHEIEVSVASQPRATSASSKARLLDRSRCGLRV
jgi:hypothetical protein